MTRLLMGLMIAITLSGCASKVAVIGGVRDMIEVPKGSVIKNVALPTTEGKAYDIQTDKDGFWLSKDAINRYQKARVS